MKRGLSDFMMILTRPESILFLTEVIKFLSKYTR
ncbi:hypothetical protein Metok_1268 [Methanothermococcus okinawensis IH1]|uniref:Uncharacterized protein n=1 Tax=Methanothermococcus okinawensis (strain DSM 14208 / JCM 11175 / IH1) TaxID=647113 RepID=F8ALK9_METOI|nr:hypothetical protein Metok_1268 [Methanothermococcus okinawensis IH1]